MITCKHCHGEPVIEVDTLINCVLYTIRCPNCQIIESKGIAEDFATACLRWEYRNTVWTLCCDTMPEHSGVYAITKAYHATDEEGVRYIAHLTGIMHWEWGNPAFKVRWNHHAFPGSYIDREIKVADTAEHLGLAWTDFEFPPGNWEPEEETDGVPVD